MLNKETLAILNRSMEHGWVMEPEAKQLFSLAGLPVPRFAWARSPEEARHEAARIGYPVVAKVVAPSIIHKSEAGGVAINIRDEGQLLAFYDSMASVADFSGIVVEEMVPAVHELIVGGMIDHQFGLVLLLGIGGTAVEVYGDVAIRMAPITEAEASSMLDELRGAKLLSGFRGRPAINRRQLVDFMVAFSQLLDTLSPYIESVDVNPLICGTQGCVIADARIMLSRALQPPQG